MVEKILLTLLLSRTRLNATYNGAGLMGCRVNENATEASDILERGSKR
jgi:hypothetical protein